MDFEIKKEKLFWFKINKKEYTVYTDGSIEYPEGKNDQVFILNLFPEILLGYLDHYLSNFETDLSPPKKTTEPFGGGEQSSAS